MTVESLALAFNGTEGLWGPGNASTFAQDVVVPDLSTTTPNVNMLLWGTTGAVQQASLFTAFPLWKSLASSSTAKWADLGDNWDFAGTTPFFLHFGVQMTATERTAMGGGFNRFVKKLAPGDISGYSCFVVAASAGADAYKLTFERKDATSADTCISLAALAADTFYDVVCWYDGANMKLYLNSVLQETKASSRLMPGNASALQLNGQAHFSHFHLGSAAPTLTQIQDFYNGVTAAPVDPTPPTLVVPSTATFNDAVENGAAPSNIFVPITTVDPADALAWTATLPAGPFSFVGASSGTTNPTSSSGATLAASLAGLTPATYTRTMVVRARIGADVTGVTGTAATDLINKTAHGLVAGSRIAFSALTGGAGLSVDTGYYVIASGLTADAFKVSTTVGGAAVNFTTDFTAGTYAKHYEGSPAQVTVSMVVGTASVGSLVVDLVSVDKEAVARSTAPLTSAFLVSSPTGGAVNYKVIEGAPGRENDLPWVAVSPTVGTTGVTGPHTITVDPTTLDTGGQPSKKYLGEVSVIELTGVPGTDPSAPPSTLYSVQTNGVWQLRWAPVANVTAYILAVVRTGVITAYKAPAVTYDSAANEYFYTPSVVDETAFPGETVTYDVRADVSGSTWYAADSGGLVPRASITFAAAPPPPPPVPTVGKPVVTPGAVTNLTTSGVTLNFTVNPSGTTTVYQVEYGPNTTMALRAPATQASAGAGNTPVSISVPLVGLTANTQYFWHVRAVNSAGETIAPAVAADGTFTTAGSTQPTPPAGTRPQQFGVTVGNGYPSVNILKSAGYFPKLNSVRTGVFPSECSQAQLDVIVKQAAALGVFVTVPIAASTGYFSGGIENASSAYKTDTINQAKALATRYGKGSAWLQQNGIPNGYIENMEIFNEPYGSWFFGTQTANTPPAYAQICKSVSIAVKAIDPNMKIGVYANNFRDYDPGGGWRNWLEQGMTPFGASVAGVPDLLAVYADALIVHSYGEPDRSTPAGWLFLADWFRGWLDGVNKGTAFGSHVGPQDGGKKLPIWFTESNRSDHLNPANRSAEEPKFIADMPLFVQCVRDRPWLRQMAIFTGGNDYGTGGTALTGFHDVNGGKKDPRITSFRDALNTRSGL
jgi:hypothetical protein